MSDNKKHHIRIAIESDDPESRAIGILKLANLLQDNGIHLSTELSIKTSRQMAKAGAVIPNTAITAVMVESQPDADGKSFFYQVPEIPPNEFRSILDNVHASLGIPKDELVEEPDGDSTAYFDDMLRGAQAAHAAIRYRDST